jgi:hypothetical protein
MALLLPRVQRSSGFTTNPALVPYSDHIAASRLEIYKCICNTTSDFTTSSMPLWIWESVNDFNSRRLGSVLIVITIYSFQLHTLANILATECTTRSHVQ